MLYSEKQYKLLREENKKLKKEQEINPKEIKLLKTQNKQKDEVIHDLDKYDYRGKYLETKEEIKELKKKLNEYEIKLGISKISLEKNSSNSC